MSNSPYSKTNACRLGSVCHSPPLTSHLAKTLTLLDEAAEELMVFRNFRLAFDTCERGLASLDNVEQEDSRSIELKAALCTLGIQALAEFNQWRCVLRWLVQHYECPERIPAKIMQMCILLHSKVGEPGSIQEAASLWLHCPSNGTLAGFRAVAELYLLHVLVPLGYLEEARTFILGEVGSATFTSDQREAALDFIRDKEVQSQEPPASPNPGVGADSTGLSAQHQGAVAQKLAAMLKLVNRRLSAICAGSFPIRQILLAFFLLYLLFVRMDPAHPSSFLWISKLFQLLKQMWNAMFAPYYQAATQS